MKGKSIPWRILVALAAAALLALAIPLSSGLAAPVAAPPSPPASSAIPTPDEVLGFEVGGDYNLASWPEIVNYFRVLDEASNRVQVQTIGYTSGTQNFAPGEFALDPQPMIMAIISDESNMARLDRIKEIQRRLADPRGLSQAEAEKLIGQGKTVVMIACALHATEIASTQMSLKLAYRLAASKDPDIQEILSNTVLLLIPSMTPDGHHMETMWYRKYRTENPDKGWAERGTPWIYSKYAGHDDNRDWFMFNLIESVNVGKQLYQEWFPQIVYDIHQMGNESARLFVPPFFDPMNPEIDPLIIRSQMMLGGIAATELQAAGKEGVVTNAIYDTWWHGGMRLAPTYHNMVGLLTEAASVGLATPIKQKWEDLTEPERGLADPHQIATNFPDPWLGPGQEGWWRLKDIMEYEEIMSMSLLRSGARYRDMILRNFYEMGMRAVNRGRSEAPYAYVIPKDQRDPVTAARMVDILIFQGVEVHKATESFTAGGKGYPAGSYVVLLSQPYRQNVTALLGKQKYPDRFQYPGGPPETPYDVAGWTIWMGMGVDCDEIADKFDAKLTLVKEAGVPAGTVAPGDASYGYAFGPEMNNAATARVRLLKKGFELAWAMEGFGGFAPGATIVKAKSGLASELATLAKELGVSFVPLASAPPVVTKALGMPKIAVYESWSGNADSGWLRLLLEKYGIPYVVLHDPGDDSVDYWANLNTHFDVIVLSDASRSSIRDGLPVGRYPPEYTGGIGGDAGTAKLKAFVEAGGTLLTLDSAGSLAITDLGVPVKNALEGVSSKELYCPGSYLAAQVDNTNPVAFGFGTTADIYFVSSPAYEIAGPGPKVVMSYGSAPLLRSGWLLDSGNRLPGKAAAVEMPYGGGKVVMIGFREHHRDWPYGTFKLLFNTFFYATVD